MNALSMRIATSPRERRLQGRDTAVLRIGLISDGCRTSFCIVKNVSATGIQARVFIPVPEGTPVQLRIGDGERLEGRVIWARNQLIGIEFKDAMDPSALLRPAGVPASRRRSSPRVSASACATLRSGGRTFAAKLCDISATGTRIEMRKPMTRGVPVVLTVPDIAPIRAFVRWNDGPFCGLIFETPLPIRTIANWVNQRMRVSSEV